MTHATLTVEGCTPPLPRLSLAVRAESCLHVDVHFHSPAPQTRTCAGRNLQGSALNRLSVHGFSSSTPRAIRANATTSDLRSGVSCDMATPSCRRAQPHFYVGDGEEACRRKRTGRGGRHLSKVEKLLKPEFTRTGACAPRARARAVACSKLHLWVLSHRSATLNTNPHASNLHARQFTCTHSLHHAVIGYTKHNLTLHVFRENTDLPCR